MNPPKRILVPLDFSEQSAHALEYAKMLGKALDASLDLLHVVPNPFVADPSGLSLALPQAVLDEFDREARTRLEKVLTSAERKTFNVRNIVKMGDPRAEILDYARLAAVDLIVMGTHGRTGVSRVFLGSVAERVVRTASCPVTTVR